MTINLSLDVSQKGAEEARRSLVRFMDQVNQDNLSNADVKFNDAHKERLGKIVKNFNAQTIDVDTFKHSVASLYNDVKGAH